MPHHRTQTLPTAASTPPSAIEHLFLIAFGGASDNPLSASLRVRGTTPAAAVARARSLFASGLGWTVPLDEMGTGRPDEDAIIRIEGDAIALAHIDAIQDPDSGAFLQIQPGDLQADMTPSELAELLEDYRLMYAPAFELVAARSRARQASQRRARRRSNRTSKAKAKPARRPARRKV